MSESNKLYKKAQSYRDLGWSVIPIWGPTRPSQFKAAAVRWREFQSRHASDSELQSWFINRNLGGVAIVCGEVSGLAVLDFDNPKHVVAFSQIYPDLADTYTVCSGGRGLPHLYFQVPKHLSTRTRHTSGVDWQFNGTYVVAPPTASTDGMWRVEHNIAPKVLTEADLSRIMGFLDTLDQDNAENATETLSACSSDMPAITGTSTQVAPEKIVRYYKSRISGGRNKALFETCCWLRDNGESPNAAMTLVGIHVAQPAPPGHQLETADQRREEALKTIMSAFSRHARLQKPTALRTIPNELRERLLAEKKTAVLRVLEAIHDAGWEPGQAFTRTELVEIAAKYNVGDWSVRKALAAAAPGNHAIFPEAANRANAAVLEGIKPPQLNAIELRVSGPTQNQKRGRGRPTIQYIVPSLRALCDLYKVTVLAGDAIDKDALGSVKRYRHALHTALLARRPGQYHRQWLAQRLGVSLRTICRYNAVSTIRVSPRYDEHFVIWQNLHNVMPSNLDDPLISHYGAFLEDETGKRYPPFTSIARMLLSRKRKVRYKRRLLNHYSVVPDHSPSQSDESSDSVLCAHVTFPQPNGDYTPILNGQSSRVVAPVSVCADGLPSLTADEVDVMSVLRSATDNAMSACRVEQLVRTFGPFAVRHALQTMATRERPIHNKAGFIVRLLKSRYGVDGDQVSAAEGVYLALQRGDGKPGISWEHAQALVAKYGAREVSLVLREIHQRDDILSPVGFLVSSLKRNAQPAATATNPEDAVTRLVDAVRTRCPERSLSHQSAQKLVKQYGVKAVMRAVSVVQERENIENPAGFVIVYLRSESKTRRRRTRT